MTARRGALALIAGGTLWALVMVAYIATHGPGTYDHKRLLFGLSRDNYLMLLSPAALMLAFGLAVLRRYVPQNTSRLFAIASLGAPLLLAVFAAGNLMFTARIGIGGHPLWPNPDPVAVLSTMVQSISLLALGVTLASMGVALLRTRCFRAAATVLLLPLSLIALAPWQPIHSYPGVLFGVGWVILGVLYARTGPRVASRFQEARTALFA
jgi:hypothetical protein